MYVYGPVPSRRLGRSLGVSPIPAKTCTYSCVYCQLGRTDQLRLKRASFFPREAILEQIVHYGRSSDLDFVTFVGDGEPTLNQDLGWLIRETKRVLGQRVAVITNGSLLYREDVRRDLAEADVVMPSLDAGTEKTFKVINRPHGHLAFSQMLRGQEEFRRVYRGSIWLEIMLVANTNDTDAELKSLRNAVGRMRPDRIYVVTPIRPPAEAWVHPPELAVIVKAQELIAHSVTINSEESGDFDLREFTNARQAILEIGSRHPLRWEQARQIGIEFGAAGIAMQMLQAGELIEVEYAGRSYVLPKHFARG